MIKVYTSEDRVLIFHLKNILENQGIACALKNDDLSSLAGEVPGAECWPELWLMDEEQQERVSELIGEALSQQGAPGVSWRCAHCHEVHEAQFDVCWKCGAMRLAADGGEQGDGIAS